MTWPLGKLGSLMTRTTVTSSCVGRGRLIRRFTSAFNIFDELVSRINSASKRKRKAQKIEAMQKVSGTANLGKPISETPARKLRSQGFRRFCKALVIDISPGKNCVRWAINESRTAPESSQR